MKKKFLNIILSVVYYIKDIFKEIHYYIIISIDIRPIKKQYLVSFYGMQTKYYKS
jgi:hypothetical protein